MAKDFEEGVVETGVWSCVSLASTSFAGMDGGIGADEAVRGSGLI